MHHFPPPSRALRHAWLRPRFWVLPLVALALPAFGEAAEPGLIQRLLTPEEFHRAGLDKLTPEELAFLNASLAGAGVSAPQQTGPRPAATEAALPPPVPQLPQGEAAFGNEQELHARAERLQRVPSSIRSRIRGEFSGWEGRTDFHLENGQVWHQVDGSQFSVNLVDPTVIIEKGLLGAFYLRVEGYGSSVKVKRIR